MSEALPPVKFRQLQYFLEVAETLHFSRAAEQLYVTQPTLSHQISDLEHRLGIQLFDRLGKTIRLTEAGQLFSGYAKASLNELRSGYAALGELKGATCGMLRIGASQSFVRWLLPPLVGEFLKLYPGVTLRVSELTANEIEHALAEGDVDVGIAYAPSIMPETVLEPILEEKLRVVVAKDHPWALRQSVNHAEIASQPLVVFGQQFMTRGIMDSYFSAKRIKPKIVCETNSVTFMLGLVRNSDVVVMLLESALDHREDFVIIPIADAEPTRTSALMWSRNVFRTAAARAFGEMVRNQFPAGVSGR